MIPKGAGLRPKDQREGNYWELPDGTAQNRCPRVHIRENPRFWDEALVAHSAFDKGFLPEAGGTDKQPALFMPIMVTISSAIEDERQWEKATKDRQDAIMREQQTAMASGNNPGFARIPTPRKG